MKIRTLFLCSLALAASSAVAADGGGHLKPPPGYFAPVGQKGGVYNCPGAPSPYTAPLDFPSKYEGSGKSRDQLNEQSDKAYKEKTKDITEMEKGVAKLVGAYMETGKLPALDCALEWYTKWADAGALLGDAPNHTGRSVRKWTLAALSSAYLRLKFSTTQPLAQHAKEQQKIESWLSQIGDKVMAEWSASDPTEKVNNHYYWAAWAGMSTAVALDRRDLFDWAVKIYDRFASQVDSDGFLPNEVNRKTRALGYHIFALQPLAMLAAFGEANGVDLASRGNNALKRVGERTLAGYDDPKIFEKKAGAKQVLEGLDEPSSKLAWLEPYCATVGCEGNAENKLQSKRPFKNSRLGGDLTAVFSAARSG